MQTIDEALEKLSKSKFRSSFDRKLDMNFDYLFRSSYMPV